MNYLHRTQPVGAGQTPPSMRRADLVNVGRSHAHQNLVQNTEFTLCYESAILIYLTICSVMLTSKFAQQKNCSINPKKHIVHFLMFIMWPTVFVRLAIYLRTRNVNYVTMQNCMFFLNAFWNVGYGIWTIMNIITITTTPHTSRCRVSNASLLELNYEVLIIFGVFPALITIFFIAMGLLCCPYISYVLYQNRREELLHNQATRIMIDSLIKAKYNANVFQTQESCMICLVTFDENDSVTPLPCDIRHYYHTSCIEQWLLINACCPLCKTEVTMEEIDRVQKLYLRKLEQHSHCCSERSDGKTSHLDMSRSHYSHYSHYSRMGNSNKDSKGSPKDFHDRRNGNSNNQVTKKKRNRNYNSRNSDSSDSFYLEG